MTQAVSNGVVALAISGTGGAGGMTAGGILLRADASAGRYGIPIARQGRKSTAARRPPSLDRRRNHLTNTHPRRDESAGQVIGEMK